MNVRVDLSTPIYDGREVVFKAPCDASEVTGLILHHPGGVDTYSFADAHTNDLGDIDHLFSRGAVVKVILDTETNMAFVQNAATNAYLENRLAEAGGGVSITTGRGAPTTETPGKAGDLYMQSGTGKMYVCVAVNPVTHSVRWKFIGLPTLIDPPIDPIYLAEMVGLLGSDAAADFTDETVDVGSLVLAHGIPFVITELGNDGSWKATRLATVQENGGSCVKTVNGTAPDEMGNVEIETGGSTEGFVKSVNGATPDTNGNVELIMGDGGGITQTLGESETVTMSQKAITDELTERVAVELVQGNLNSGDGSEASSATRLRSDYISVDDIIGVISFNPDYEVFGYFFDANGAYIGTTGGWLKSLIISYYAETYPNLAKLRIVARHISNSNIVSSDVVGNYWLVYRSINRIKQSIAPFIEYTPLYMHHIYLDGDVSTMTKENAVPLSYRIVTAGSNTVWNSGTCTCKWQGTSSVRNKYPKRNYTIKFDEAIQIRASWGTQKKYCLKANWIDPSALRNVVGAKLWSDVVGSRTAVHETLAASPNYGAIDGIPFVVVINGEFTGLYTFNIPKDGWMFGMGNGANEYIVGAETNGLMSAGFHAEATFTGDSLGQTLDFSVEYAPEGVDDSVVIESFKAMHNKVRAELTTNNPNWETSLGECFDIDSIVDYYIFMCCIAGYDNMRKNILYATYDGVKWFASAYDMDATFGAHVYGESWYEVNNKNVCFNTARQMHKLFDLIYNNSKEKLKARYKELRSTILSDENLWYKLNNFANSIPRTAYNLDAEKWPTMQATSTANISTYMDYYRMHCAYLDKEIDAL